MLITLSNGIKATLSVNPSVISMTFKNSSTELRCFINGNLEDFLFAHISENDRNMVRSKMVELIVTKEKNLNWLNNGSKMTALEYANLYLNIHGLDNCKRIIADAKDNHNMTKGIYTPNGDVHNRINLVYLQKAIKNYKGI